MAQSDTIADLLTRLRNASSARHRYVDVQVSKMRKSIVDVLQKKGFIEQSLINDKTGKMRIFLKYTDGREPVLSTLKRMSSPGLRRYVGSQKIPRIRNGLGMAILSTPRGVMDGDSAREQNLGGELICIVG
jgi:small subunit ribosomal protein S8